MRAGSWLFLCEIICSLPLEPDAPALDRCGTCTLCLDACPTGALVGPGPSMRRAACRTDDRERGDDSRQRCVTAIGTHVYGCDICQEVCPWNPPPPKSSDPAWRRAVADLGRGASRSSAVAEGARRAARRCAGAPMRGKGGGLRREVLASALATAEDFAGSTAHVSAEAAGAGGPRRSASRLKRADGAPENPPVGYSRPPTLNVCAPPRRLSRVRSLDARDPDRLRRGSAAGGGDVVGEQPGDAEDLAGRPSSVRRAGCSTGRSRRRASIAPAST